jgi:large conductance mechanosensitive channel
VIQLGAFINTMINFVIIAFAIFMVVRVYNKAQERFAKQEEAARRRPRRYRPTWPCSPRSATC